MVPPHGRWLRQQEVTQHIHPTKQGYRVISVPATGLFWSTIWSTLVGASARGGMGVTVFRPDPRLGIQNCQAWQNLLCRGGAMLEHARRESGRPPTAPLALVTLRDSD